MLPSIFIRGSSLFSFRTISGVEHIRLSSNLDTAANLLPLLSKEVLLFFLGLSQRDLLEIESIGVVTEEQHVHLLRVKPAMAQTLSHFLCRF